jgi:O-antigen ligase
LSGFDAPGWSRPWVVLTYFVLYWWIEDARTAERFVRWLVMASCVVAAYGIAQHYTGADWYRDLLGRPRAVHPRIEGAHGYASVGFFRNYLTFAHVLIIPLGFALVSRERWMRLGAVPLLALAIVLSTARGAWVAVIAMALVALVAGRTAAMRLVVLAGVATFALAVSPGLRQQIVPALTSADMNAGRLGIYRANLDIVRDHPLFGLGFGRYQRAARPYYARHPEADRRSHAHNNFLQMAAEAGLVGLAAFTLVFATILRFGIDAVRRCREPGLRAVAVGGCLAIVGFLVGGLTQYSFGDNEVATAMWATAAVLMRLRDVGR